MSIYKMRTEMGRYFKWLLLIVVVPIFVIGGMNYFGGGGPGRGGRQMGDQGETIATVNGIEVSRGEFERLWGDAEERARDTGMQGAMQLAGLRVQVFQQMIENRLLISAAEQLGVKISDRDVDREIDKFVEEYLRQDRRKILGKLSPDREATDPRRDREYKNEIAQMGYTIQQREELARMIVPREEVRAQLARSAIDKALASRVKPVTDKDVINSYNVYKIRQILVAGRMPQEQLENKASKIIAEAKAGADFAKLAADNSVDPNAKKSGGAAVYSYETRQMFMPEVRDAIERLKPGGISGPIKTPFGIYVIKLESVESRLPEKLDAMARNARREEIKREREALVQMEFQQEVRKKQRIDVKDPELLGYWQMMSAASAGTQEEYNKQLDLAITALKEANKVRPQVLAKLQLIRLLDQRGKTEEAVRLLYPMLVGKTQTIESADLRIMLGDMLLRTKVTDSKTRAIEQYQEASLVAPRDLKIHEQLVERFEKAGRPDLAAKERAWIADYNAKLAELKELRKKSEEPKSSPSSSPRR